MLAIVIPVGLLIGLSLGALGGGGSILTVPALVYLLHQSPHAATTGSLLIVGVAALAGMAAHARAGRVRFRLGAVFGLLGVAGSVAGSRLSASVDQHLLLTGFAVLMLVAALAMRSRCTPEAHDPGSGQAAGSTVSAATLGVPPGSVQTIARSTASQNAVKVVTAATVVGLLTGFFGVGGGFVIVPALALTLGLDMAVAVGTSLLVIAVNSAAALAARTGSSVQLDWPLLGTFAAVAILGSFAGNSIASRVPPARLAAAFTVLLVAIAVYTGVRSVPHLF